MSRSQQEAVSKQSAAQSKELMGDANTALGGVNTGLADFNNRLNAYYAADPYKAGGEFQTRQGVINASRANATSAGVRDSLDRMATRSGENTAGYANDITAATEQATLDQGTAQAKSEADRIADETRYQQTGLEASKFPTQVEGGIFGSAVGGSNAALNTSAQSAKAPGFWDWFIQNAQQGAQTGAEIAAA